ncbi:MAG: DJ-1/PfpI family protein [Verrucomicrobiae bacterium]|nr:DJ-1/PfpI family protein [Verrucomicrobiae bacterium]
MNPSRKRTGILLFDEVEVLDFCGPFEVFSVTRLHPEKRREEASPFEVFLVSERGGKITATGGLKVESDHSFASCPPLDILVVPGGWGTRALALHEPLLQWIRSRAVAVETLASVCTGSLLLAAAGLLEGRRATTHWQSLDRMRDSFPNVRVSRGEQVVEDGSILTSAGISAGIDMALRLVTREFGEEVARATARYMEYPFPESNARRIRID